MTNQKGLTSTNRPTPQVEVLTPQGPQTLDVKAMVRDQNRDYVLVELEHQGEQVDQAFLLSGNQIKEIPDDAEYDRVFRQLMGST